MGMLRQLLEVFTGRTDESKFEHEYAMVKSADIVIWVDYEASLKRLNCTR